MKFGFIALPKIVALVVCRCDLWWNQNPRSQVVTGPGILVTKVSFPGAISNF